MSFPIVTNWAYLSGLLAGYIVLRMSYYGLPTGLPGLLKDQSPSRCPFELDSTQPLWRYLSSCYGRYRVNASATADPKAITYEGRVDMTPWPRQLEQGMAASGTARVCMNFNFFRSLRTLLA